MRHILIRTVFLVILFGLGSVVFAQQKRLYIANDDHTDYIWSANAATYTNAFINQLDYYINLMETQNDTILPQFQHRYNCDNSVWVYEYEKAKSPADFQRLIQQIQSGHISVPFNPLVPLYGGQNAETALRGMYYAGYLERQYGIDIDLAVAMEDQTFPLGISSLWAGAGAKYSWKGVCGCAAPNLNFNNRKHDIYYSKGRDGKGVLMKWYEMQGNSQGLGGYAEARFFNSTVYNMSAKCGTLKYPYQVAGAFGYGWDNLQSYISFFPSMAQAASNTAQQVFVSNENDFFQDFESQYAANIPSQTVTFGNDWDLLIATLAQVSGDVKRSTEKLRTAEALATLVALKDTGFGQDLGSQRELAWISLGKYFDHAWTADGPASAGREQFQRDMESNFSNYVDTLYNTSLTALGSQIMKTGNNDRFFVFNPLGWERTDVADYPYSGSLPVQIIDLQTQQEVPSQIVVLNGVQYIRILASNIPSIGYKTYEIVPGASAVLPVAATFSGGVFENDFYELTISNNGSITSFIDKTDSNYQYKGTDAFNDFGSGTLSSGNLTLQNAGPVSVTVLSTSASPYIHFNKITLYKMVERVDIDDQIYHNIGSDTISYQFPVNLSGTTVWHEEVGAVISAKLDTNGGYYSSQNARYDWQTANHFVHVGNSSRGLTISNLGAQFFKLGNSTITTLDETSNKIQFLAAGKVAYGTLGINSQGGDQYFRYQFSLQPKPGIFNQTASMKMSLEHQNPLVCGEVAGGASYNSITFSLFNITEPDVLLWALKPSEEGAANGIIARVWNQADSGSVTIDGSLPVLSAYNTSHVETDINSATLVNGNLSESIGEQEIKSFRLFFGDIALGRNSIQNDCTIKVYPNPTGEILTIDVNYPIENSLIRILNLTGKEVLNKELVSKHSEINIGALSSGIYFVRIDDK
ncbi:MAG: T9SS type A sorting domain-containing protein [Bacteroidales bacterium]|nr:T9SS type A sorting domain-containing protein [Bacteroidales bacterium]MCF8459053.1 T9SS type A sorting domain-containing protein [Bacteroidales bacterium]